MELTDLRSLATVLCAIGFAGVVFWAYHAANRKNFDEAAMLPFADDPDDDKPELDKPGPDKPKLDTKGASK
ncbi:MAG: CcoQ/FixQ family Cbb3-type cytochrome c oxidase assembly chaperone [Pseudomonadales bacterium]|nr:CcoQ/FixQ family Cbb3-type cytochrome c oxidase assembly chaperone [Pseudomonadales bacterium]